jgi:hypothetical protein
LRTCQAIRFCRAASIAKLRVRAVSGLMRGLHRQGRPCVPARAHPQQNTTVDEIDVLLLSDAHAADPSRGCRQDTSEDHRTAFLACPAMM